MERVEFEELRSLPDKQIVSDIEFVPSKQAPMTFVFEQVEVSNSLDYELLVYGSYVPDIPSLKFNFAVKGIGPICRMEVNGPIHKDAGRTHKHTLETENCPRRNLPSASARTDLDLDTKTPKEIWEIVCREANITHVGRFIEPSN